MSDKSLVIGAPTGSGKTVIFELTIIELLIFLKENNLDVNTAKIIYS